MCSVEYAGVGLAGGVGRGHYVRSQGSRRQQLMNLTRSPIAKPKEPTLHLPSSSWGSASSICQTSLSPSGLRKSRTIGI